MVNSSSKKRSKTSRHFCLYAKTKDGKQIHIDDCTADKEEVYCIYCNCRMVRKRGDQRIHHYAHNPKDKKRTEHEVCSYDLYLQELAKQKLLSWFKKAPHIYIHFDEILECARAKECKWLKEYVCFAVKDKKVDIKKACTHLKFLKIDKRSSLSSTAYYQLFNSEKNNNRIFIVLRIGEENYYDLEKEHLPSGRIIEWQVETERDIDTFVNNYDLYPFENSNDLNLHYYGFKKQLPLKSKEVPPQVKLLRLILYHSGEMYINDNTHCEEKNTTDALMEITIKLGNDPIKLVNDYIKEKKRNIAHWGMAIASNPPYSYKYCAMCKHNRWHTNEKTVCKLSGEILKLCHLANNCNDYEANSSLINSWNKKFEEYKQNHPIEFKSKH